MVPARFSGEVISVIDADNTGMLPTNRPAAVRKNHISMIDPTSASQRNSMHWPLSEIITIGLRPKRSLMRLQKMPENIAAPAEIVNAPVAPKALAPYPVAKH
jgi:hypothetical protein